MGQELSLGLGINERRHSAQLNYSPVGDTDLNLWAVGRSGFTMPATVGDPVQILTPTFVPTAIYFRGDKTRAAEKVLDGNSYTIYTRVKQLKALTDYDWFLRLGHEQAVLKRGLEMYASGQALYLALSDGTNSAGHYGSAKVVTNMGTTVLPLAYIDVLITINFAAKTAVCKIYNPAGAEINDANSINLAGFTFGATDNTHELKFSTHASTFTWADFKKFSAIKTLANCQDHAYTTDLQLWYPDIVSGMDVTGNANHLTLSTDRNKLEYQNKYYGQLTSYLLDRGYDLHYGVAFLPQYIPYDMAGGPIAITIPNLAVIKSVAGNLTKHNLADSNLRPAHAIWNKSNRTNINATIELTRYLAGAIADFSFYNANNLNDWHISEFNKISLNGFYEADHKNKVFLKFSLNSHSDRNTLDEIASFNTNKTGSDLNNKLKYFGDIGVNNTIVATREVTALTRTCSVKFAGHVGMPVVSVNWGDGAFDLLIMDGTLRELFHVYATDGTYTVTICNPQSIKQTRLESDPIAADVAQLDKAINLELTYFKNSGFETGNVTGWSNKVKGIIIEDVVGEEGSSEIGGSMAHMMDIEEISVFGNNTIYGNVSDKVKLKKVYFTGNCGCTGDMSDCVDIWSFETAMDITNWSMDDKISVNHAERWTKLAMLCTDVPMEGDITNSPIRYFSHGHATKILTADVTNWPDVWELGAHQNCIFSGSIAGCTKLMVFDAPYGTIEQLFRFINMPALVHFVSRPSWFYTSAQINQLLADLVTNKDAPKTNVDGRIVANRVFVLNTAGSEPPIGQGLIDKALLEAAPYNYTIYVNE